VLITETIFLLEVADMASLAGRQSMVRLPVFDTEDESASVALALYAVWATRTGRALRGVPVSELTTEELEDFWTDDQLPVTSATATIGRAQ
jgi:hypothetical protein